MTTTIDCPIWGTGYKAILYKTWMNFRGKLDIDKEDLIISERAGGPYRLTRQAYAAIWRLEEHGKARLTSWLVGQRLLGIAEPIVTDEIVMSFESVRNEQALSVSARAERLLLFIDRQTDRLGAHVPIFANTLAAYAWSESTDWRDVDYLLDFLRDQGWIDSVFWGEGGGQVALTVFGRTQIEGLSSLPNTP
ncbi:MAG: hypothetical protein F4X14_09405 [Caldilineaceae bacterium SB0661_bin_32]|uniref:Uncharacterized protein n=1 Tax=Caldilineaceae bacterium SB0661_bin_32 TaxID=2605255 RepID=A0A6B1D7M3_9CHLR|nr:hypothetical protein [Caldilineaceae bacterium SB0661_bin_32]